nr:MAG: Pentaxin family protein [Bacteriophage sp.]
MGTISDKLMRIINTKEDIRQALISKGYDVPTSIPFKEYAKMILDLPCKADSFPDIEGIVARYSASGLTNEQMAANPVWVDKTSNGHDLQLKNLAWGGMSGVGGYADNWNSSADWAINSYWVNSYTDHKLQFIKASSVVQARSNNIYNAENVYKNILNVNGLTEAVNKGSVKALRIIATDPITSKAIKTLSFDSDGVIQISFDDVLQDCYVAYFLSGNNTNDIDITIEQLPLYPGALVFDGVDDWAGCDNLPLLPKEKGYSIIALRNWITRYDATQYKRPLISNLDTNDEGAFLIEYRKDENVNDVTGSYNSFTDVYIDGNNPITWQTSSSYNGQIIKKGTSKSTNKLCICKTYFGQLSNYANAAIWEIVILDHDATEEELTKIKDYFVKTYPWLFPDQAWTVVGKTNEDEDRATIANITGNGNNLVLSNFGFAEGSGYGLYAENYAGGRWVQSTDRADLTWTSYSVNITSVKVASTQLYYQSYPEQPSFIVPSYKIKVYGLKDGQTLSYRQATSEGQQLYKISEDGTYTLPSFLFKANGDWYGFTLNKVQESCDITIEQIPYYEGYLVTDGVDDKIISSIFKMGNDWTVIGDWELINTGKNDNAGIVKFDSIVIYNYNYNSMLINIKNGRNILIPDQNTVNAICSDGRIYSKDWKESIYNEETESTSKNFLTIGYSGNAYTKIAFKNLAIYPTVLSREDCIKAYNYLQTLKAK